MNDEKIKEEQEAKASKKRKGYSRGDNEDERGDDDEDKEEELELTRKIDNFVPGPAKKHLLLLEIHPEKFMNELLDFKLEDVKVELDEED
eukprot:CAMPEP_0202957786 /NCGR_PEP_ID=MMETSP1396-20130829/2168_1 /ASSEMBLY_ACC=CAM_ASM_000872 /TAXON_ID= /ORGANISM="Pseudokeronopsis sp., Strain Brazil" /LENGTH=89 /DNA_ID=CAMNT_0049675469 /DNA_START=938 /DNA_END=1207 /DNA_ORIENTATION=+